MSTVVDEVETARKKKRRYFLRRHLVSWLFVLPILLIHLLVIVGPSLSAVYFSLTEWSGVGEAKFIGLKNYNDILHSSDYFSSFSHNLIWLLFFLTVPIAIALFAASFLSTIKKGGMFFRASLFVPYILPSVVTASIWSFLMSPTQGIGAQLANIGIKGFDVAYLGRTDTALLSVAFVDNWHWWGFLMVLFLTAMQSVPAELYDVAKIDGANRWQEFRHVTLPGIRPTLVFMLIMTGIWSFLAFDYVWILTQGGPAGASSLLSILVLKAGIYQFEAGYASAIGLTMSFFAGIIVLAYIILQRRGWEI